MKILYVTTISRTVHAFLIPHIAMLVGKGHQVDVACSMDTPPDSRLLDLGCRYFDIDFQRSPLSRRNIDAYRAFKKLLLEEKYDLVHTHTPVASACVRLACRKMPAKVFYTAHGFHFYKGAPLLNWLLYYPVEKLLARHTDVLITINREDFARAQKSLKAKKVLYIPGVGIHTEKVAGVPVDAAAKRAELELPEDAFVLLSVGELNDNKNHETAIRAVATLPSSRVFYLICGVGDREAPLLALIEELGLRQQVRLLGYRTDVPELLQVVDLFVHPSFREGLPVALMEAMAAGLPCVVSRIRGNADLIDEGSGGFLFRAAETAGLAGAVGRLLSDETLAASMGCYNREAIRRYDISSVLTELDKIYAAES